MKNLFYLVIPLLLTTYPILAQSSADQLLGEYHAIQSDDEFKVRATKNANGTYKLQVFWVKNMTDAKTGQKRLDDKNPDLNLRQIPCNQIVLCDNLLYNEAKKQWTNAKIYDPHRGIRANATLWFEGTCLKVKGSLFGISETHTWEKIK